jgi:UDP-N-acetylglucosamine--N-acetylmuramyl-(pentapeptide) pyrophosphoryl-undecaprenol N-acetylglucosamine transferase
MATLEQPLHIGLACGGTGGHIFPGLATAEVLHARGHRITLWMAGKDIEHTAVGDRAWTTHTIRARGMEGGWKQAPRTFFNLMRATRDCVRVMEQDVPDVVLGMGSYACVGPVRAALRLGVPVVLHESNAVPGRAIAMHAKKASRVAACFESTRHGLKNKARLVLTGMPLRADIAAAAAKHVRHREPGAPFHILSMGGSRGARAVNLMVRRAVRELHRREPNIFITHLTGVADEAEVRQCYEKAGVPHRVSPFAHDMADIYGSIDLAVCRAGAATCAELSAFGIPSLLVPYPYAARNHQVFNAREFQRHNAADLVEEKHLEAPWLAEYLEGCIHTPERLERLGRNIRARGNIDASDRLANLVEEAAHG